jgi:hypothetical protein
MLINALTLSLSLVYPMCSPYLSLMTLGQHGMVYPFISFSNCGYKIKLRTYVLRVSTDRVLEGSMESTGYSSWHDSFMLYM